MSLKGRKVSFSQALSPFDGTITRSGQIEVVSSCISLSKQRIIQAVALKSWAAGLVCNLGGLGICRSGRMLHSAARRLQSASPIQGPTLGGPEATLLVGVAHICRKIEGRRALGGSGS